ncbi:alcohol dehydrogenase catalytic domain-containing protein [Klebsiella pneumoniae subsp. pneumoniae]|nr:alcohol dehydrogenase catalytic domain-containing protein [Klebsiella pneumoniae subsp. pneumoniae]
MATRIEFFETRGPEVLQAVEFTPRDPAEHEIQVENKAIGINYIDTYVRSGLYPPPSLPSGLGTEAAGIVSKVGHGVTHIKVGDRVVYAQSALGASARYTMCWPTKRRSCRTLSLSNRPPRRSSKD